jgi:hypothetical protein
MAVKLKINPPAVAPGMEHFPWLAHAVSIELTLATIRASDSSLNLCLHYHLFFPSPHFPHFVIFKSEQNRGAIILAFGHGGKISFPLILCCGVLTTIKFSDLFFHTI